MCGIGAISLSPTSKLPVRQLAHELLLHSEERGKVASGFGYAYGKQSFYVKDPKPGGHMPLKVLPKDARTVIIHTRNATFGDPEENDNNHPVVDDREEIILVHNGVITNHKAIRDGEKEVKFPEVDSAVLPWLIREYGADGLKHTDGWAAVAWLDQRAPGELNLARVKGAAPMVVVYLDDGSIVMGSTFPIIHASLINVGYGGRILGGWEVPELTHLRIANGTIVGIGNLTPYSQVTAKYRGATMTYQEKQRLEKITNGDAVSYGKDNPVHAPSQPSITKTTPSTTGTAHTPPKPQPSAGSLASAGVTPGATATGSGVAPVKSIYSTPQTPRVQVKPGEDPMAAFKDAAAKTPPSSAPISYGTQGSYFESNRHSTRTIVPEHPIPMYLERRLRYWVSWEGDPTMTIDTDTLFIPSDFAEDKGYLFNIFMELIEDCESRGLLSQWGVFDHEGKPRDFSGIKTMTQVIEIMSSYAEKIGPKEERRAPKGGAAHGKPAGRSGSDRPAALDEPDDDGDDDFPGMSLRDFTRPLGLTPNGNVFDKGTGEIIPMDQIEDHEWSQLIWAEEEEG